METNDTKPQGVVPCTDWLGELEAARRNLENLSNTAAMEGKSELAALLHGAMDEVKKAWRAERRHSPSDDKQPQATERVPSPASPGSAINAALEELRALTGEREEWAAGERSVRARYGDYSLWLLEGGWHALSNDPWTLLSKGPFATAVEAYHGQREAGGWQRRPENWPNAEGEQLP